VNRPITIACLVLIAGILGGCERQPSTTLPPPKAPPSTLAALIDDVRGTLRDHADVLERSDVDEPEVPRSLSAATVAIARVRAPLLDASPFEQGGVAELNAVLLRLIDVPASSWEWADAELVDGRREEIQRFLGAVEQFMRTSATLQGRELPSSALR
jgi:hypothetical protein